MVVSLSHRCVYCLKNTNKKKKIIKILMTMILTCRLGICFMRFVSTGNVVCQEVDKFFLWSTLSRNTHPMRATKRAFEGCMSRTCHHSIGTVQILAQILKHQMIMVKIIISISKCVSQFKKIILIFGQQIQHCIPLLSQMELL